MDQSNEINTNPKVEALITNITHLMDEAEQMLGDSTSHHAEHQVALLRTRGDGVERHLTAVCANAGRLIGAGIRRTDRAIRTHPYESLAVALGAGALFGTMLVRRRT